MITAEILRKYIEKFNQHTYPIHLYHELVVEGKETPNKFAVMGAWKTGAIRAKLSRSGRYTTVSYSDAKGNEYVYTDRWKSGAPVGYATWMAINVNQELYRQRIPVKFTAEQPTIVAEMVSQPGFGFIWALFVLHCYYPEEYPLYDQHVYRAYKYHESGGRINRVIAPNSWGEYTSYRSFFLKLKEQHGYQYWLLDRGLWAFGKEIKQRKSNKTSNAVKAIMSEDSTDFPANGKWVQSITLGGKAKNFNWGLDKASNLYIIRPFKNGKANFKAEHLGELANYVSTIPKVSLKNDVQKMGDGVEEEGLGMFIIKTLGLGLSQAQAASQLAALFVEAKIWDYNGQKRGMEFWSITSKWKELLRDLYEAKLK